MQGRGLPSTSSRASLASSSGLRARDLRTLQTQLEEQEREQQWQEERDFTNSTTRVKSQRRTSEHSAAHSHRSHASRPVSLRPSDRQLSGGSGQFEAQRRSSSQLPQSFQSRPSRSQRAPSNASITSTVLSAGLKPKASYAPDRSHRVARPVETVEAGPSSARSIDRSILQDSPLRRWCRLVEKSSRGSRAKEWAVAVAVVVYIKWSVGLGGWSGKGHPPLYGDLEAQRHWLALTNHLPISRWYWHNLDYWGLDYPPLTAYHSLLLGYIARMAGEPRWAELEGRLDGRETVFREEKAIKYMRSTVVASDILFYMLPVAMWCAVRLGKWTSRASRRQGASQRSTRTLMLAFYSIMLQPSLVLIDSGHFQYNSVMLGLTLMAVLAFHEGRDFLGASLFVCSMCFKQMALYYAPAIFAYLLGKCFWLGGAEGLNLFTQIGIVSTSVLLLCFGPFLGSVTQMQQALLRIFPFQRGLFEDKVANVWCSLNIVIKLRQLFNMSTLARLAAGATLSTTLPLAGVVVWASINLRRDKAVPTQESKKGNPEQLLSAISHEPAPTITLLPHLLFASAMAFFLFSFQVHEKSILLPLMPLTLMLAEKQAGRHGVDFDWAVLINNVGVFSMYPLLKRDGLALATIVLTLFWNFAIGAAPWNQPSGLNKLLSIATMAFASTLIVLDTTASPPAHLPDLFVVLNLVWCCGIFGIGWLWSLTRITEEIWALVGSNSGSSEHPTLATQQSSRHLSYMGSERSALDVEKTERDERRPRVSHPDGKPRRSMSRTSSVASSAHTAVRRSKWSPLISPAEESGEDIGMMASDAVPAARVHRRKPSATTSHGYGSNQYLRPYSNGNMSTQVSPSKTLVPSSEQHGRRNDDVFGEAQDLARWKQAALRDLE